MLVLEGEKCAGGRAGTKQAAHTAAERARRRCPSLPRRAARRLLWHTLQPVVLQVHVVPAVHAACVARVVLWGGVAGRQAQAGGRAGGRQGCRAGQAQQGSQQGPSAGWGT